MSVIQGYPPVDNSLPRPCFDEAPVDINASICIDDTEYRQLVSKAAALDIITADIKAKLDYGYKYSLVNEDIVLAATGMNVYKRKTEVKNMEAGTNGEN